MVLILPFPFGEVSLLPFILTCLGNCGNPDELSFLYLRISSSVYFQKHLLCLLLWRQIQLRFLERFSQIIFQSSNNCLMHLNVTVLPTGREEGPWPRSWDSWVGMKIKARGVLSSASESHKTSIHPASGSIDLSCWEGKKRSSRKTGGLLGQ